MRDQVIPFQLATDAPRHVRCADEEKGSCREQTDRRHRAPMRPLARRVAICGREEVGNVRPSTARAAQRLRLTEICRQVAGNSRSALPGDCEPVSSWSNVTTPRMSGRSIRAASLAVGPESAAQVSGGSDPAFQLAFKPGAGRDGDPLVDDIRLHNSSSREHDIPRIDGPRDVALDGQVIGNRRSFDDAPRRDEVSGAVTWPETFPCTSTGPVEVTSPSIVRSAARMLRRAPAFAG